MVYQIFAGLVNMSAEERENSYELIMAPNARKGKKLFF